MIMHKKLDGVLYRMLGRRNLALVAVMVTRLSPQVWRGKGCGIPSTSAWGLNMSSTGWTAMRDFHSHPHGGCIDEPAACV